MMALARKVAGKDGIRMVDQTRKQETSKHIRKLRGISSCQEELRIRRLLWLTNILEHPSQNIQLRAALGGVLKLEHTEISLEFTPWLNQVKIDLEWYMERCCKTRRPDDLDRSLQGLRTLESWQAAGTLVNMLNPRHMKWFRSLSLPIEDLHSHADPSYPNSGTRLNEGEIQCEETHRGWHSLPVRGPAGGCWRTQVLCAWQM